MILGSLPEEPGRVDEPEVVREYAAVFTPVVAAGWPVIVRRNGEDLAAVIPLGHLELVREILAHRDVERFATTADSSRLTSLRPLRSWFDDDGDSPFKPERYSTP